MIDPNDHAPALSVVVAAIEGADLDASAAAIVKQAAGRDVEILLAFNPDDAEAAATAARWPQVQGVIRRPAGLVPHLWGEGIARSRGRVIAITIGGCVPEPGWLDAILRAHEDNAAAIGGPIEQAEPAALTDRAVVFARYGPYFPPVSESASAEIPGDNGSYKRADIEGDLEAIRRDGFWEADVNAALRRRGRALRMHLDMRVRHVHTYSARAFCAQRWRHGRLFGRARAGQSPLPVRLARVLAAPVALIAMTARAAGHARRARRLASFLSALPLVVAFYACWVAGEAIGLMMGPA